MSSRKLEIENSNIIEEVSVSYLNADIASGVTSFTVDSISDFAINQVLILGKLGQENSEIVKTHTATTPSGSTVTLLAATSHAHNRGDTVYISKWDQYELSHATSATGSKTVLTTTLGSGLIPIDPEKTETIYYDSQYTSGGYFVRKYNSITAVFSDYSDYIPYTGFSNNAAGTIIQTALLTLGEEIDDEVLTEEFLLEALHEGRQELDTHQDVERWSFRTVFDYNLGQAIPGQYQVDLPDDLRDPDTFKNVLAVKIGKDKFPLSQVDKRGIDRYYQGVAKTTLNGAITTGSTTIVLTFSGDFDDSGTVSAAAADVSSEIDVITYTANTLSTNTLSGVTGIAAAGHADATIIWQGASFGNPLEYTIFENKIQFSCPFSDEIAGEGIYMDYYASMTKATTMGTEIDEPFPSIYIPYLRYRIKVRKDNSLQRDQDDDYKLWVEKRDAQVKKEFIGQDIHFIPDVPR